jgi:hypothetical protein
MGFFSCCRCVTEPDVELVDISPTQTPEYLNHGQLHKYKENYNTFIEFDKNNRKIETRIYNEDCFTQPDNNVISETYIYSLRNPDNVLLRISIYDNGQFMINRYDFIVDSYVVIDMDNPMNCFRTKFIDDLRQKNTETDHYHPIMNEKWLKEYRNLAECPDYGFKIFISKNTNKCTFEIGSYVH